MMQITYLKNKSRSDPEAMTRFLLFNKYDSGQNLTM